MATISERINNDGSIVYRVNIRLKGTSSEYRTFSKEEDAKLWAAWREDMIENVRNFDVPAEDILTLDSAIDIKIKQGEETNLDHRTLNSIRSLKSNFSEFLDKGMNEITFDMILETFNRFITTKVRKGGSAHAGGKYELPSKQTVLNRYKYLGTVYGNLKSIGISIPNVALDVAKYLTNLKE